MFTNNDCPRGWDILFERYFEPQSMKLWCRLARADSYYARCLSLPLFSATADSDVDRVVETLANIVRR